MPVRRIRPSHVQVRYAASIGPHRQTMTSISAGEMIEQWRRTQFTRRSRVTKPLRVHASQHHACGT